MKIYIVITAYICQLGESGDTFHNLDCGNHTLDVRCSPVGFDDEFDLSTRNFMIRCPSEEVLYILFIDMIIVYSASISLSGSVTVSGSSATLSLSSSTSGSFMCSLDGAELIPCKFKQVKYAAVCILLVN